MSATEQTIHTPATIHPIDKLLRADRLPHILCPGCGIGTVIHGYALDYICEETGGQCLYRRQDFEIPSEIRKQ